MTSDQAGVFMPHANLESSVVGTEIIDFDGKMGVVIQIFQIIWKNTTRQFSKKSFRKKSGKTWKMTSKIHLFRIESIAVSIHGRREEDGGEA